MTEQDDFDSKTLFISKGPGMHCHQRKEKGVAGKQEKDEHRSKLTSCTCWVSWPEVP